MFLLRSSLLLVLLLVDEGCEACTALAVDKAASFDGATTFTAHNIDDNNADDFRLAYVPGRDLRLPRPIYPSQGEYPRYVGYDRGPTYLPVEETETRVNFNSAPPTLEESVLAMGMTEGMDFEAWWAANLQESEIKKMAARRAAKKVETRGKLQQSFEPTFLVDFWSTPALREFATVEPPRASKHSFLKKPENEHLSYGYYEYFYPLMNDAGLTFGESTCGVNGALYATGTAATAEESALNQDPDVPANPGGLQISHLLQLAAERCATARCAVRLMGALADHFGFTPEGSGLSAAGEAAVMGDGEEAWVFNVMPAPVNEGKALWAAQRVPEGHVAPIANNFSIRKLECGDKLNFLCSDNVFSVAKKLGVWMGESYQLLEGQELDFGYVFGLHRTEYRTGPEHSHSPIPFYTTARLWRTFSLLCPDEAPAKWNGTWVLTDDYFAYPFSAKVTLAGGVTKDLLADVQGDVYQGSELDLSVGFFAGPFGNPRRVEGGIGDFLMSGQFPRAISMPRTLTATIGESRESKRGLLWAAMDSPATSVHVPLFQGASDVSKEYREGNRLELSRESAWWNFNIVAGQLQSYYSLMVQDVHRRRILWTELMNHKVADVDADEATHVTGAGHVRMLNALQTHLQRAITLDWSRLSEELAQKYNDGTLVEQDVPFQMKNSMMAPSRVIGKEFGYPAWWLEMGGYSNDIHPKFGGQHPIPAVEVSEVNKEFPFENLSAPDASKWQTTADLEVPNPSSIMKQYGLGPFPEQPILKNRVLSEAYVPIPSSLAALGLGEVNREATFGTLSKGADKRKEQIAITSTDDAETRETALGWSFAWGKSAQKVMAAWVASAQDGRKSETLVEEASKENNRQVKKVWRHREI